MIRILFLFVSIVWIATCTEAAEQADTLAVGAPAPKFYLRTLDGKDFFLSAQKCPLVLSFFATWCEPCKKEIPHLQQLQSQFKDKDLKVYLVNSGEQPSVVKVFVQAQSIGLPVLMDRHRMVGKQYGAKALPMWVAIQRDGTVQAVHTGYKDGDEKELEDILEAITKQEEAEEDTTIAAPAER